MQLVLARSSGQLAVAAIGPGPEWDPRQTEQAGPVVVVAAVVATVRRAPQQCLERA